MRIHSDLGELHIRQNWKISHVCKAYLPVQTAQLSVFTSHSLTQTYDFLWSVFLRFHYFIIHVGVLTQRIAEIEGLIFIIKQNSCLYRFSVSLGHGHSDVVLFSDYSIPVEMASVQLPPGQWD